MCSKRIPCTPLPVFLRLHHCGECGLGTAVVSLDQGSQKDKRKEQEIVDSNLSGWRIGKGHQKFTDCNNLRDAIPSFHCQVPRPREFGSLTKFSVSMIKNKSSPDREHGTLIKPIMECKIYLNFATSALGAKGNDSFDSWTQLLNWECPLALDFLDFLLILLFLTSILIPTQRTGRGLGIRSEQGVGWSRDRDAWYSAPVELGEV